MNSSNTCLDVVKLPTRRWSEPRFSLGLMNIPIGIMRPLPERWVAPIARCANGESFPGKVLCSKRRLVRERLVFFPSSQRAQVTALACTLPKDSGKPLSRWSSAELAKAAQQKGIVPSISPSTIRSWLQEEKIKPWQYHSWQKPTDPHFLEKAVPILNLYEQAQNLARLGHLVVCVDEKTSIQARKISGGATAASPGHPMRVGDRYQRKGALQLFAALWVSTGETIASCFDRKRFVEFQTFLQMLFNSLWCKNQCCLHLILDNGTTHAPKKIKQWIKTLRLPFEVQLHWLPIHASWLDQIEIVFSQLQRKVLTPNHFENLQDLENVLMNHFAQRNQEPKPIEWTYTASQLKKKMIASHSKRRIKAS